MTSFSVHAKAMFMLNVFLPLFIACGGFAFDIFLVWQYECVTLIVPMLSCLCLLFDLGALGWSEVVAFSGDTHLFRYNLCLCSHQRV